MVRLVEFYSCEVGKNIRIPVGIDIEKDDTKMVLNVHVQECQYWIDQTMALAEAEFREEQ